MFIYVCRCTYVHTCVEDWTWVWVSSSITLYFICFESWSSLKPNLAFSLPCATITGRRLAHLAFTWVPGIWTLGLTLAKPVPSLLSQLPSLVSWSFCFCFLNARITSVCRHIWFTLLVAEPRALSCWTDTLPTELHPQHRRKPHMLMHACNPSTHAGNPQHSFHNWASSPAFLPNFTNKNQ